MPQLNDLLNRYGPPPPPVCLDWAWQIEGIVSGDLEASVNWNDLQVDHAGRLSRISSLSPESLLSRKADKSSTDEAGDQMLGEDVPDDFLAQSAASTTATELLKQLMQWSSSASADLNFLQQAFQSDSGDSSSESTLVTKTLEEWTRYNSTTETLVNYAEGIGAKSHLPTSLSVDEPLSATGDLATDDLGASEFFSSDESDSVEDLSTATIGSLDATDSMKGPAKPKKKSGFGQRGFNKWMGLAGVALIAGVVGLYIAVSGGGGEKKQALAKAKSAREPGGSTNAKSDPAASSLVEQKELEELAFGSSNASSTTGTEATVAPSTQPQSLETIEMSDSNETASFDDLESVATNELTSSLASLSAPIDFGVTAPTATTSEPTADNSAVESNMDADTSSPVAGEGASTEIVSGDETAEPTAMAEAAESSGAGSGSREVLDGVSKVTKSSVQQKGQTDIDLVSGTEPLKLNLFPMAQTVKFDRALARAVTQPIWQIELLPIEGITISPTGLQTTQDRSASSWTLESADATSDSPKLIVRASLQSARSATLKWQIVIQSPSDPPILLPTNAEVLGKLGESLTQRITQCQIQIETMKEANKGRGIPQATRSLIAAGRRSLEEQVEVSESVVELIKSAERMVMSLDSGLAFRAELYDGDLQSEPLLRFQPEIAEAGK